MSDYKNYSSEEMDLMEQMQDEIEKQRGQISKLSNEKSQLVSLVQDLEKKIQEQSVRIEKQNKSDLQLREAKETLKKAEKTMAEAKEETEVVKADYIERLRRLEENTKKVQEKDIEVSICGAHLNKRIKEAAEKKSNLMRIKYKGIMYGSLLYGIVITSLLAQRSSILKAETICFFKTMVHGGKRLLKEFIKAGIYVGKLGDKIPHETVGVVVSWILRISVAGALIIGVVMCVFILIRKMVKVFLERYADEYSLAMILLELAIVVVYGDIIAKLPINLLLLFVLVYVVYMIVRRIIDACR